MKHYTLAELASPEGSRAFMDDCEKRENSVCQDIVEKLERAIQQGTDWSDAELCDIVQKEIEDILQERAEAMDTLKECMAFALAVGQDCGPQIPGQNPKFDTACQMADRCRALLAKLEGGK